MKILCLETATEVCSVALTENGKLLHLREDASQGAHSRNLTVFIEELLTEHNLAATDLAAVAVSKGPGSYPGLRIGVSAAKGLCYAANLPLIAVSTLKAMAAGAKAQTTLAPNTLICPMIDARRMEVYSAFFTPDLQQFRGVAADIITPEIYAELLEKHPVLFCGNGAPKCKEILSVFPNATFLDQAVTSAQYMAAFAYEELKANHTQDVAYFEPFYLKEFIAGTPKKML